MPRKNRRLIYSGNGDAYYVSPSAIGSSELSVTTPEVFVTASPDDVARGNAQRWWREHGNVYGEKGLEQVSPEFDLISLAPLVKPIVNTGLRSAGRMISKAVENHRYPLGRPQVPKDYITISPKTRTKIGDVEIDNPELAYRQGGKDMIEDFIDNGIVRGIDSRHIWGEAYANNPMFQHGSLFSKELSPGLLVSNGKTKAADVLSRPISEEAALKGGITFRIPDEPFTLANTQAYIFEPNYGYRRVLAEETPSLNWADATRTPQITAENAASITPEQWTAAQDAAIARGDMAEAQRLRDLHFKVGAPDTKIDVPLWSSSEEAFNSFDLSHFGKTDNGFFGYGHYMTPIEDYAASYHPINRKFYVNMENPYIGNNDQYFNRVQYVKDRLARRKEGVLRNLNEGRVQGIGKRLGITENTSLEDANRILDRYVADETIKWNNKYVKYADEFKGKDGVLSWRDIQGVPNKREGIYKEVVVPRGEQIKSADAVTYDDNGIRIPLGERDNFSLNDIRYGLLPLGIGLTGYGFNQKRLGGRVRFEMGGKPKRGRMPAHPGVRLTYDEGGYVRKNNNPVAFDTEGNLIDQVTGDKGTLLLPDVTVTQNTPTFDEKIVKGLDTATRKFIEGLGNVTITPLLRGYGAVAKGLYDVFNREPGYKDAKTPYGVGLGHERDNIINVGNGIVGTRNRLEMMGFRNVNGNYRYPNTRYVPGTQREVDEIKSFLGTDDPNAQYEFLRWCAENANVINSYYHKPTAGNAWTRHGLYGDSAIVVAPNKKTDWKYKLVPNEENKARSMSKDQARYVAKHIDDEGVELKSGDIVDMRYPGSSYADVAWNEGDIDRANSHTGTIIKTGPDKEHTYVAHYFKGGLQVEPIGDLIGVDWSNPYITGIRRPGSKRHPYKRK